MTGYVSLIFDCANCGEIDMANPNLVMSICARFENGHYVPDESAQREPICERCARRVLERFIAEGKQIPEAVQAPDYFERAYGFPAAQESESVV